jgi:hypothetical protein
MLNGVGGMTSPGRSAVERQVAAQESGAGCHRVPGKPQPDAEGGRVEGAAPRPLGDGPIDERLGGGNLLSDRARTYRPGHALWQ